jgi:ubiquitin-conjugating enzyme E2 Q
LKSAGLSGKIVIEVRFPPDFPRKPFSLRVVRPRFRIYTGHITAGGSVCIEALTTGSSPGRWQSEYSLSGILALVATNMLDDERQLVSTATGPGGMSGPARVDMRMAACEYSEQEAAAAFSRMLQHHAVHGW